MRNKKNLFKTMLVLAMAMIMTLAMGITALAEGYSIKVTPNNDATHTYEAYQIFKGEISTDGSFVNVEWGANITAAALLTQLKASAIKDSFTGESLTVDDVLAFLTKTDIEQDEVDEFARAAGKALTGTAKASANTKTDDVYELSVAEAGYYLVKDKDGSQTAGAYTLNLLKVAGNVEITAKADVPTVEKKIVEDTEKVDFNTASIGESVSYEITSKVPDMTGYTKYFFVITDTLSAGLTYNNDIEVAIEGVTDFDDYTATYNAETRTLKVVFNDFLENCAAYKNKAITVTYSATLNESAVITSEGNTNTVNLTYSNNPNITTDNDTDEPGSGDPVGVTPDQTVKTYTTQVKLIKVDGANNATTLPGAKFKISGTSYVTSIINSEVFKQSATGTFYMLKDGTYTTNDTFDDDKYDDKSKRYEKVTEINKDTTTAELNAEAYVNAEGEIVFKGLGAGTYEITEMVAPEGYNMLKDPITLTISTAAGTDLTKCVWSTNLTNATIADDTISFKVENNKGIQLPTTGGIGTTIFYVVGGILVVGAAILLVTKKRMSVEEN